MDSCEEIISDDDSDSPFESEVQEYVDSDKADSDIEIELYSQIHYAEDIGASTHAQSFQDGGCVEVSPIKSIDSLHSANSSEGPVYNKKEVPPRLIRFDLFESSTPSGSVKNDKIIEKQNFDAQMKLPKAKVKKRKTVASHSNLKLNKSSEDSFLDGSIVICSNDDGNTDGSVICLDSDEHCDSSSIMLNIEGNLVPSKDMILLDSTASSDDDFFIRDSIPPTPSDREESLKFSFSTSSLSNQSRDPWHIDPEDRFAYIKKHNRYHDKHSSVCNNCKKKGHLSKDCLEPRSMKCYICGQDHVWSMCHQRMCGKCLTYGHSNKKCWYRTCDMSCNLCKMRGHTITECPDIWRRYHLTTSLDIIVKGSKEMTEGVKKYCYNCGHEGHYGHECLRPRMSPDSFPTWPLVISYKDPCRYLKKHTKNISKESEPSFRRREHCEFCGRVGHDVGQCWYAKKNQKNQGESSNSGRQYDLHPRHKHNKKHRSRADDLREMISGLSSKHPDNSKKLRNRPKNKKKQFKEQKYISLVKGNNFHSSPPLINLDADGRKSKKRKKRDLDKSHTFKRKKQKLNATV